MLHFNCWFPCVFLMWDIKVDLVFKIFPHILHSRGSWLSWTTRTCRGKLALDFKFLPQIWHSKGPSASWTCIAWVFKVSLVLNILWQMLHSRFKLNFSWTCLMCRCRLPIVLKFLPQILHSMSSWLPCTRLMWSCKSVLFFKIFPQIPHSRFEVRFRWTCFMCCCNSWSVDNFSPHSVHSAILMTSRFFSESKERRQF